MGFFIILPLLLWIWPGLAGAVDGHINPTTEIKGTPSASGIQDTLFIDNSGNLANRNVPTPEITTGFGLFVDANSGTDTPACDPSVSGDCCGAINSKCATIGGAFAVINQKNDNGFQTCSGDPTLGCGRCSEDGVTQCNEDSDCTGTCDTTDSVCSAAGAGTCTGDKKRYGIQVEAGTYNEQLGPNGTNIPSPGHVDIRGVGRVVVKSTTPTPECTFDVASRQVMRIENMQFKNFGTGNAVCVTGGSAGTNTGASKFITFVGGGFTADGNEGLQLNIRGTGNVTIGVVGVTTLLGNGNAFRVEAWRSHCSTTTTRACLVDGDCPVTETCTGASSGDFFFIDNNFVQTNANLGDPTDGIAAAVEYVGKSCGSNFNLFIDGMTIQAADNDENGACSTDGGTTFTGTRCDPPDGAQNGCEVGETCEPTTSVGLRLVQEDCEAGSPASQKDKLLVTARNLSIVGNNAITFFKQPNKTIDVGTGTTLVLQGQNHYDACRRVINGTLSYVDSTNNSWGGGAGFLGALDCDEPPNPLNGEMWFDSINGALESRKSGVTYSVVLSDWIEHDVNGDLLIKNPTEAVGDLIRFLIGDEEAFRTRLAGGAFNQCPGSGSADKCNYFRLIDAVGAVAPVSAHCTASTIGIFSVQTGAAVTAADAGVYVCVEDDTSGIHWERIGGSSDAVYVLSWGLRDTALATSQECMPARGLGAAVPCTEIEETAHIFEGTPTVNTLTCSVDNISGFEAGDSLTVGVSTGSNSPVNDVGSTLTIDDTTVVDQELTVAINTAVTFTPLIGIELNPTGLEGTETLEMVCSVELSK